MRKQVIAEYFLRKSPFHGGAGFFVDTYMRCKHDIGNNLFHRTFLS